MNLSKKARAVELDIFGALLGTLAGVMVVRLFLLAFDLGPYPLLAIMGIGAWSGAFVMHLFAHSSEQAVQSLSGFVARMQKPFLTTMLWLLGASAVIGVVTVLTTNDDLLVRLLGTTFATAIAASLLWRASCVVDRETHQLAALYGMGVVFLVYLLIMPLIWDFGDDEGRMMMTAVMLGLTAPAALLSLRSVYNDSTRTTGFAGIGVYVVVVVLFLVAIWHQEGRRWGLDNWWLQAAWALTWLGPFGVASLAGVTWTLRASWRWFGVVATAIAWLLVANSAWDHGMEVTIACIISVAVTVAYASVVILIQLTSRQQWVRFGTIAAAVATAVLLDIDFISQGAVEARDTLLLRFAGAMAILWSSGTLALAILAVINRGMVGAASDSSCTAITIICPRCRKRQEIAIGGASCLACRLRIHVRVGEEDGGAHTPRTDLHVTAEVNQ